MDSTGAAAVQAPAADGRLSQSSQPPAPGRLLAGSTAGAQDCGRPAAFIIRTDGLNQ